MQNILIVGGGPAAVSAAISAKRTDPESVVTLVMEEDEEPYEKPPLSKGVLLGTTSRSAMNIAGPAGLESFGICLIKDRCLGFDSSRVELEKRGSFGFDALVLATGSVCRQVPSLPPAAENIYYLRTLRDAERLKQGLSASQSILIIGAGLIGLEVAASARQLGLETVVVEADTNILRRSCPDIVSNFLISSHLSHGVVLALGSLIKGVDRSGGKIAITTTGGDFAADMVVVGVGVAPNDEMARRSGLAVADGILVDSACRTSTLNIFAAGDVARFQTSRGDVRLETWAHAQDQGRVAGANAAGADLVYDPFPTFWSEQYDSYIQSVGWQTEGASSVVRRLAEDRFCVFDLQDDRITRATAISMQQDMGIIRRLVARQIQVPPSSLRDSDQPLKTLLR